MSAKFWSDKAKWTESAVSWTGAIRAGGGDADSDVNATSTFTLAGAATSTPGVSDG